MAVLLHELLEQWAVKVGLERVRVPVHLEEQQRGRNGRGQRLQDAGVGPRDVHQISQRARLIRRDVGRQLCNGLYHLIHAIGADEPLRREADGTRRRLDIHQLKPFRRDWVGVRIARRIAAADCF